jgi:hypothetical protein
MPGRAISGRGGSIGSIIGLTGLVCISPLRGGCIAQFEPYTGDTPMPEDTAPEQLPIPFEFGTALLDAGAATAEFDPYQPIFMQEIEGRLVILDAFTQNREWDTELGIVDLDIKAPKAAPSVGTPAAGTVTATDIRWKFRYKCSRLNKVSGFSDVTAETDLTSEKVTITCDGSYDPQVDIVELFRNLTGSERLYYKVAEGDDPGGGSTVGIEDDLAEVLLQEEESDILIRGRSFNQGRLTARAKCFTHLGFTYYYGLIRMGTLDHGVSGYVNVTNGSQQIDMTSGVILSAARVGQRMTLLDDTTEYEIIHIDNDASPREVYVYPAVERATLAQCTFTVEDTRNGLIIDISESRRHGSVPTANQMVLGGEMDDSVVLMFSIGQVVFAMSHRRIWAFEGDATTDPWETINAKVVVEEGAVGLNAACLIPGLGAVYVEQELGVRLFNGARSTYLGDPKKNLILGEWERFTGSRLSQVYVGHDPVDGEVVVSYARDGEPSPEFQMIYNVARKEWTGPWTRRVFSLGSLADVDGSLQSMYGDDLGDLIQDHLGDRDLYDSGTLDGTVDSLSGRVITANHSNLPSNIHGAPVLFVSASKVSWSVGWIVDSSANTMTLIGYTDPVPSEGWSFYIGKQFWFALSGYIDLGDEGLRKELHAIWCRIVKGDSGSVRCRVGVDGGDPEDVHSGEESVANQVYLRFKASRGGVVFQIELSGVALADEPRITSATALLEVRGGEKYKSSS